MDKKNNLKHLSHYQKEAERQGKLHELQKIDKQCDEEYQHIQERYQKQLANYQEEVIYNGRNQEAKEVIEDSYQLAKLEHKENYDLQARQALGLEQEEVTIEKDNLTPQPEYSNDDFFERVNDIYELNMTDDKEPPEPNKGKDKEF